MPDWNALMNDAKLDVESGVKAWTTTIKDMLGSNIVYAYAKGSAMKNWDTPIDYVPIISDLDIHMMPKNDFSLLKFSSLDFDLSIAISEKYESAFNEMRPNALHIPRSQVMSIEALRQSVDYIPPRREDIRMLFGAFPDMSCPSNDIIRQIDLTKILDLEEYVLRIPYRLLDRTGLDYWSIIRELTYRVSPTPIRLLTQNEDNPLEVWSWNRTHVVEELEHNNLSSIASNYQDFYRNGWNLFLSGFTDNEDFRKTIRGGYYTLRLCLQEAKKMTG